MAHKTYRYEDRHGSFESDKPFDPALLKEPVVAAVAGKIGYGCWLLASGMLLSAAALAATLFF
jgi:hypothetical protein